MTPHNFLKYTAKTNCGDCGHPACLAFAVAVTKGGENPEKCPHLDRTVLSQLRGNKKGKKTPGESHSAMQNNRDMALVAHLKTKIRDIDFKTLALKLGASWTPENPDELSLQYLARPVRIGKQGVVMDNKELLDPRDQILLYNYVHYQGGRQPDNDWIGLENLPNSISKVRTLATYCETRIAKLFSGRPQQLAALCQHLSCQPGPSEQSCSVGVVIPVLPRLPQYLLFWDEEPEDGFEAKVKVLFDKHVMDFLDLESLVFTAERLADRFAELDTSL